MNEANEALKNWQSLLPALEPLIDQRTKSAVRRKKMDVATAPNGTSIGVQDPGDTTVINIPYQPACTGVSAGQSVWVEWLYDNFSTAIAVTPGNGVEPGIAFRYLSGSVVASYQNYSDIITTTLPAGYFYLVLGFVDENTNSEGIMSCILEGITNATQTRTIMNAGGGCVAWGYQVPSSTDTTVYLRSYGYNNATYAHNGKLLIIRFPAISSF